MSNSKLTKPMQLCFINDMPPSDDEDCPIFPEAIPFNGTFRTSGGLRNISGFCDEIAEDLPKNQRGSEPGALEEHDKSLTIQRRSSSRSPSPLNQERMPLMQNGDDKAKSDMLTRLFNNATRLISPRDDYKYDGIVNEDDALIEGPKQIQPPPKDYPKNDQMSGSDSELYIPRKYCVEGEDFFTKQARLQAEARMALAQVRPMAHMQLEVERQTRKKSPIAEIVGIPGFGANGRRNKLVPRLMHDMNIAQLQVLVNDLHSQIESLNEELVHLLVNRDDLHMEQDSMLVDIEDLTRRAQEIAQKKHGNNNKNSPTNSCTVLPPPSTVSNIATKKKSGKKK